MAEKHSSPDWFARLVGIIGIVLSIFGLVLGYLNYRWQRELQEETTAERMLVHLDASRTVIPSSDDTLDPKGEVGIEIVNIGLRRLFIKNADMLIGNRVFPFYNHDLLQVPSDDTAKTEPVKLLEPSEAVRYKLNWDFSEHPLKKGEPWSADSREEDIEIQVETTKKTFSFQHQTMDRVDFDMPLRNVRTEKAHPK